MKKFSFLLLMCLMSFSVTWLVAQTNPSPFSLASGDYSFTSWASSSAAGTYPTSIMFHLGTASDPTLSATMNVDYTDVYTSTYNHVIGEGTSGFGFYNSSSGKLGEAVLALNTTNRSNIVVGWVGRTIASGARSYGLRLQYRVSTTGTWTDFSSVSEYLSGTTGASASYSNIALPSSCENQAVVQLRWRYYSISGIGSRPHLAVDDISVTSQIAGSDPAISVTSPNTSVSWSQYSTQNITWTNSNFTDNVKIELYNGTSYSTLASSVSNTGSYSWDIGSTATGSTYKIRVSDAADGVPSDESDTSFSVVTPTVTVTSPNGGESWEQNTTHNITWTNANYSGNVKVELYDGSAYSTLAASVSNTGSYSWAIGATAAGTNYKARVSDASTGTPVDVSDATFSIVAPLPPAIAITSPNGGESWEQNGTHSITWSNTNFADNVTIQLYNGSTYSTLASNISNTGSWDWNIGTQAIGANYSIIVSDAADNNPTDSSDAVFSLVAGGTVLNAGDISIIGMYADDPDYISFVTWVDLNSLTTIKFTDNAWNGTALTSNEGVLTWTAGTAIPAGTVITGYATSTTSPVAFSWNIGTCTVASNFMFSASGDNLFAFQGTTSTPSFIAGILLNTSWMTSGSVSTNSSYLPAVLATANIVCGNYDNARYNGTRASNTVEAHIANIANTVNWLINDTPANVGTMNSEPFAIGEPAASSDTTTVPADNTDAHNFDNPGVSVSFTGNHGSTTLNVYRFEQEPTVQGTIPGSLTNIGDSYWTVESTGGAVGNYDITFDTTGIGGIGNFATLHVLKRHNNHSAWQDVVSDLGATLVYNDPFVTIQGLTSFSDFVLAGNPDNPLPVTLTAFNAAATSDGNHVRINWTTASEMGMVGYVVVRSGGTNPLQATELNIAAIQANNQAQAFNYNYTDDVTDLGNGVYNYWLQMIDLDGSIRYSQPTSVTINHNGQGDTPETNSYTNALKGNFPNPFNPETTIFYTLADEHNVNINIYNSRGQLVKNYNRGLQTKGEHSVNWNGTDNHGKQLSSGIYYVRLQADKFVQMHKAVMLK